MEGIEDSLEEKLQHIMNEMLDVDTEVDIEKYLKEVMLSTNNSANGNEGKTAEEEKQSSASGGTAREETEPSSTLPTGTQTNPDNADAKDMKQHSADDGKTQDDHENDTEHDDLINVDAKDSTTVALDILDSCINAGDEVKEDGKQITVDDIDESKEAPTSTQVDSNLSLQSMSKRSDKNYSYTHVNKSVQQTVMSSKGFGEDSRGNIEEDTEQNVCRSVSNEDAEENVCSPVTHEDIEESVLGSFTEKDIKENVFRPVTNEDNEENVGSFGTGENTVDSEQNTIQASCNDALSESRSDIDRETTQNVQNLPDEISDTEVVRKDTSSDSLVNKGTNEESSMNAPEDDETHGSAGVLRSTYKTVTFEMSEEKGLTYSEQSNSTHQSEEVKIEEVGDTFGEKKMLLDFTTAPCNNASFSDVSSDEDGAYDDIKHNIPGDEAEQERRSPTLLYGNDGYTHYKLYIQIEKNIKINELKELKRIKQEEYHKRVTKIDEIVAAARAYYKDPTGKAADDWRELRKGSSESGRDPVSNTDVRFHLSTLNEYRPVFSVLIILAQIITMVVLCIIGKLEKAGLEPELKLMSGVKTFLGTETVHKWAPPNIWIGPSERYLIGVGAVFAPCMRQDLGIQIDVSSMSYSTDTTLGCCEMVTRNTAGTTTEEECEEFTHGVGVWHEGIICSKRAPGSNSVAHILKPCCTDLKGNCRLVTHEHCTFLGGRFHTTTEEHCSQVNCLSSVCGMGELEQDPKQPWLPKNPRQWWRFPLSLFYHHGVVHVLLVSVAQFVLFTKLEKALGWLRVMLIYLITGIGGLVAAALFSPYIPQGGATATVFGMMGVILVELFHFWSLVKRPVLELVKITVILIMFLLSGTLPYINNFSILTGLIMGVLCAFIFLPFVSFTPRQKRCRRCLLVTSIPLLFVANFVLLFVFYKVQTVEGCEICSLINCIPYTDKMCDAALWSG